MPLQELRAPPPVTGLADLGGILLDTSRTYAAQKRQDQLLAQKRGQELQDVESQRNYEDFRHNRGRLDQQYDTESQRSYQDFRDETLRQNRLSDSETELKLHARMAILASLRNEGLLAPGEENDEAKVTAAYEEFKNRGLEKLYDLMMHAPGPDGQPILNPKDVADPEKVKAAKVVYAQRSAELLQQKTSADQATRVGGQAAADRGFQSEQELAAKTAELERVINTPIPHPTAEQINNRAREMWLEKPEHKGKKPPTDPSSLGIELADARKELEAARFSQEQERNAALRQQVLVNKTQQIAQGQETGSLGRQGFFANPALATPHPVTGMAGGGAIQQMQAAPPSDALDFVTRSKATPTPAAPAAPASNPLGLAEDAGLFTRPTVRQGRASVLSPDTPEMYDAASQAAQAELARLTAVPLTRATTGRVAYLNGIISQLEQKKKAMVASTSAPAGLPAVSDSIFSTPVPAFAAPPSFESSIVSPMTDWWKSAPAPAR